MKGQHFKNQTKESIEQRFWEKVDKTCDCWIWKSTVAGRYGQFKLNKKGILAHRFSYEITFGSIPQGIIVCHSCDNPLCVNPNHLWLGSNADNSRDMVHKNRAAKGDKNGSKLYPERLKKGSQNPSSVLTESQVIQIRSKWELATHKFGIYSKLANEFGVDRSTITRIIKHKRWIHI